MTATANDVRVVRALPEDLERALADMPRASERTKAWARDYYLKKKSTVEIAREYGVEPQLVGHKVRAVRAKLIALASPVTYVRVTLSLPLEVGQELQSLAAEVGARASREAALDAWKPVVKAAAVSRKKLKEQDPQ